MFPRAHSLSVAWTGVEDHSPRPPGLDAVAALLGQDGEVAQGEVAVDALVDAAKLVGTLEGQDPPPAGFGLGRLARLAVQDGLAEMQLGVVGVDPEPSGTIMDWSPRSRTSNPRSRSPAVIPRHLDYG